MKAASRDALMWLNSFEGKVHALHFGTSPDNLRQQGVARNGGNVVKLKVKVARGRQYYGRVDVKVGRKVKYIGDVWSFKTI